MRNTSSLPAGSAGWNVRRIRWRCWDGGGADETEDEPAQPDAAADRAEARL